MVSNINRYIDHTLLKADAAPHDISKLCAEAKEYDFYAVCVNPGYVAQAANELKGSATKVACVIGFPLGASDTSVKAYEAVKAVIDGADEVDMVINVGRLKAGDDGYVLDDVKAVTEEAHAMGAAVKVIIETCMLTDDEKIKACLLSKKAGADFVKTSTGFASGGASARDVALMKSTVGASLKVKASGGIRDLRTAAAMIDAGAERLGASAGVAIMKEYDALISEG